MAKTGRLLTAIAVVALLCGHSHALADNTISATVSPNPTNEDESVLLRVELTLDGGNRVGRPSFTAPKFDVVGQSSSIESSTFNENGKYVLISKYIYSFVLYPKESGNLSITNIQVPLASDTLKAQDITVQVKPVANSSQQPANQNDDDENQPQSANSANALQVPRELNSDFTVFVAVDKKTAYVGEPVIVEYWVYDQENTQSMEIKKWPTFAGFWKEDLEISTRTEFEPAYVGNKRVRRALLGRFALYGIKPGRTNLDKLVVDGTYFTRLRPQTEEEGFFLPFFGQGITRKASHASQDVVVEVLPIPESGRPANFGGAVGSFTVSLKADKQSLDANAPLNLQVVYEGVGNFPAIDEPKLGLPPEFELFESNVIYKDSVPHGMRRPVANKKTYNFVVIPRKPGNYNINPLQFTFFDPVKKSYQSIATAGLKIQVTGTESAAAVSAPSVTNTKTPQQILVPKSSSEFYQRLNMRLLTWILTLLASIAAVVLLAISIYKSKWLKSFTSNKSSRINSAKLLQTLQAAKGQNGFYALVEETLHQTSSIVIGKSTIGMLRDELELEWRERKLPAELFFNYYKLLDKVAAFRYGQSANSIAVREQLIAEMQNYLTSLQKAQLAKRKN